MHQTGLNSHPKDVKSGFFGWAAMKAERILGISTFVEGFCVPFRAFLSYGGYRVSALRGLFVVFIACVLGMSLAQAQSGGSQSQGSAATQGQAPAKNQSPEDIPDTPSVVQPP